MSDLTDEERIAAIAEDNRRCMTPHPDDAAFLLATSFEQAKEIDRGAELIEICEAANSELVDRVQHAEATIAEQAKEIERLRSYIRQTAPSKSEAKRVIGMCGGDL